LARKIEFVSTALAGNVGDGARRRALSLADEGFLFGTRPVIPSSRCILKVVDGHTIFVSGVVGLSSLEVLVVKPRVIRVDPVSFFLDVVESEPVDVSLVELAIYVVMFLDIMDGSQVSTPLNAFPLSINPGSLV